MKNWTIIFALLASSSQVSAQQPHLIPMHSQGSHTYYIDSEIPGVGEFSMLVDTGSGYSVINEYTLDQLIEKDQVEFVSKLRGKMADGSERVFPLYKIDEIKLGKNCVIREVKAAVLPGNARQIIGLSTLIQAAPFSMSFNPPELKLSQCHDEVLLNPSIPSNGSDKDNLNSVKTITTVQVED